MSQVKLKSKRCAARVSLYGHTTYQGARLHACDGETVVHSPRHTMYSKQLPCTVKLAELPTTLHVDIQQLMRTSTTGFQYVHFTPDKKNFQAQIWNPSIPPRGKLVHLGIYQCRETAAVAVILAQRHSRLRVVSNAAKDEIERLAQNETASTMTRFDEEVLCIEPHELYQFL